MHFHNLKLVLTGFYARWKGQCDGLPGLEYDTYGRLLAFRQFICNLTLHPAVIQRLVNPVSSVRYFEFAYVGSVIKLQLQGKRDFKSILDVSSPRLFPFWLVEKGGLSVHMINPDQADLNESRKLSRFVKNKHLLEFSDGIDATRLPFDDSSFDAAISISVIEHVIGQGDSEMVSELQRVVRPGGYIIITFPVMPVFTEEYRESSFYNRKQSNEKNGRYFFQRLYDPQSIRDRILSIPGIVEKERLYWAETPVGWFSEYEGQWIEEGLSRTALDPELMSRHFINNGNQHPQDGMGICCMTLIAGKQDEGRL